MRELGSVVAIEKRSLWVETSRQTACGSCSAQKGCGTSLLAKLFPNRQHFVRVLASADQLSSLQLGQQINIEVS
jgi:sigma-E factor negative regulatory protein RseC